jgi:solute carrier family 25 S-adenosylmethionine transporter 26
MVPDSISDVLAGVLAGAIAAALTTPMDVIVTHAATRDADGSNTEHRSALQLGMDLVRDQGPASLTRGVGLRMVYYAPLVGAFFGLYEYFRNVLES